jgi:hypothetical protein
MAKKVHGKNGLIYVGGSAIAYGNAWDLTVDTSTAEVPHWGATWQERLVGISDWSGSITAWHDQDSMVLFTVATSGASALIQIYPDRTDLTTYWSGFAFMGFGSSAGMGDAVGQTADLTAASSLTATGFTA